VIESGAFVLALGLLAAGAGLSVARLPAGPGIPGRRAAKPAAQAAESGKDAAAAGPDLGSLTDQFPLPLWEADADRNVLWANARARQLLMQVSGALVAPAAGDVLMVSGEGGRRTFQAAEARWGARVLGYAQDVTGKFQAESVLARRIADHDQTLDRLQTAIAIFGRDQVLTFHNPAFGALWRLPETVLAARPTLGEVLESLRERRRLPEQADFRQWKQVQLGKFTTVIEPAEEMWHLPDGSTLRIICQPHPNGGLMFLYEDVTERLALERSLNTLTAVQKETLDRLSEGVAVFSSDGRLTFHNPAFAALWGIETARLMERPHVAEFAVWAASGLADLRALDDLKMRVAGVSSDSGRGRFERLDGRILDWESLRLPDGGTMLTYQDVTADAQYQVALRQRKEALEAADRLKSEFISHVSYQLRSPLHSIMGFAEMMQQGIAGTLNPRQDEYVRYILEATGVLLGLTDNILDLSSIDAGELVLNPGIFDVDTMIRSVVAIGEARAAERGQIFATTIDPGIGRMSGDETRLKQVLLNLLSNALKFTSAGDQIEVGARRDEGTVTFWVRDSGIGIDPEVQTRVFEEFQTGGNVRQRGAGLGLTLCRRLVELHGGTINLDSQLHHGTVVTFTVPQPAAG